MTTKTKLALGIGGGVIFLLLYTLGIVVLTIRLSPKDKSELELYTKQFNERFDSLSVDVKETREAVQEMEKEEKKYQELEDKQFSTLKEIKRKYDLKRDNIKYSPMDSTTAFILSRYH